MTKEIAGILEIHPSVQALGPYTWKTRSHTRDDFVCSFVSSCVTLLILVKGDYSCLCNYDVEAGVLSQPDPSSHVIGYMYEFDCESSFGAFTGGYYGVQFEHKVRIKYGPAFLFC